MYLLIERREKSHYPIYTKMLVRCKLFIEIQLVSTWPKPLFYGLIFSTIILLEAYFAV